MVGSNSSGRRLADILDCNKNEEDVLNEDGTTKEELVLAFRSSPPFVLDISF